MRLRLHRGEEAGAQVAPGGEADPEPEAPTYGPGEMGESDWSPHDVTYTDGQRERVHALSYVLVFSTRTTSACIGTKLSSR